MSMRCGGRNLASTTLRPGAWLIPALTLGACAPEPEPAQELREATASYCENLPRAQYAELERVPVADDWFEVYRVGTDVYAIYEPFQFQEIISYLILGTESALLFDTGMGISRIGETVRELTGLPVTVLNSHTHMDHVGGNAEFERILAMDTDFTRERARGRSNAQVRGEVAPEALCRPLPDGLTQDDYRTRPFVISETIRDGHRIELGDRTLEVLAVPGHTPDAIALLDRERGYLWTGDSFYEGPIWLFAPETDLDAYEASMRRLAALAPGLNAVFPAHNTPVASPERLEQLSAAIERVRAGQVEGRDLGRGEREYVFDGFSLLMREASG